MRAAPACQVSLRRFGAWRASVLGLTVLGAASIAAWSMTREPPGDTLVLIAAGLSAVATLVLGMSLTRVPATDLRWDGRIWHLGPAAHDPVPGDLRVAIDLGSWMLLRFTPTACGARQRVIWLPVQRRGLESQWHALRCAVHSPRPAPADDAPVEF